MRFGWLGELWRQVQARFRRFWGGLEARCKVQRGFGRAPQVLSTALKGFLGLGAGGGVIGGGQETFPESVLLGLKRS